MEIAKLILCYLQTLLTWPVIGGIIAIVFLKMFREPLSCFLRRIVRGQLYGVSIEASTPSEQQEKVGKELLRFFTSDTTTKPWFNRRFE